MYIFTRTKQKNIRKISLSVPVVYHVAGIITHNMLCLFYTAEAET